MKKIKFSADYDKLPAVWEGTQAILMAVTPAKTEFIKNGLTAFYRYDTTYRGGSGSYPLNFEDAIILFFIHLNTGKPFTTIRRDYPSKREYYEKSIYDYFILEKEEFEEKSRISK